MIGQTISQCKLLEKLGSGGVGPDYKTEDTKLKRTIVLNFPPADHNDLSPTRRSPGRSPSLQLKLSRRS